MVFTSHLFLFYFLPLVLLLYYMIPLRRYRTGLLAVMSYSFYAWANPPWAIIMLVSTLVDYLCGVVLIRLASLKRLPDGEWQAIPAGAPRSRGMKLTLFFSIASNLALLGFFKYYNFTEENLNRVAAGLGLTRDWLPVLNVVLPVGISFYTFQSMSYAIDVYRGDARPMTNVIDFCCFEALFPQLVAGPIVRYADVAQQLRHRTHRADKFARGIAFFACGMAKKVLLANPMGHMADAAFGTGGLAWYDAWMGAVAYAFQIYFDFSGYSDMAVGLGLMFGFVFMQNFNAPYHAQSITDFWRRWHISLSTWLRDYVYIPLGGNRRGRFRTYVNLLVVMLIGGFWHGASWNFILWGALHGTALAFERLLGKESAYRMLPRPLRVAITFFIVCIGWVFFRTDNLSHAIQYLSAMFALADVRPVAGVVAAVAYTPYHLVVFFIAAAVVWGSPQLWRFTADLTPMRATACMALLVLSVLFMWTQTENPFLYFQF